MCPKNQSFEWSDHTPIPDPINNPGIQTPKFAVAKLACIAELKQIEEVFEIHDEKKRP